MSVDAISEFLGVEPTIRVKVRDARSCCVYACFRGDRLMYIGRSYKSMERPLLGTHATLKRAKPDDELVVWRCATREEAKRLEFALIVKFGPAINCTPGPWWKVNAGMREATRVR